MVLIRTESSQFTLNGSFGELIDKFQDRNLTPPPKKNPLKTFGLLKK